MSKKKLTLSVDERVIQRAKRFSKRNETTVSELFSEFVQTLDDDSPGSSIVENLTGLLTTDISREDYREHLRDKYLK